MQGHVAKLRRAARAALVAEGHAFDMLVVASHAGERDGQLLSMPINLDSVDRLHGLSLRSELDDVFAEVAEKPAARKASEDAVVARGGRERYNTISSAARLAQPHAPT